MARQFPQSRFQVPAGAAELLLVRHGESAPAVEGTPFRLVDGQGDPELSPTGREQAERVGERLAGEGVDAIYATSLCRTSQTAAPLAARLGLDVRLEADLREVHLGEWEGGVFRQKAADGDPVALRMHAEERWDVIPGAEPADAFSARVRAAIERVSAASADQRVAVFTHGGVIAEALRLATGSRPFAFLGADNASVSHLVVAPGRWVLRRFNDTAHLGQGLTAGAAPPT